VRQTHPQPSPSPQSESASCPSPSQDKDAEAAFMPLGPASYSDAIHRCTALYVTEHENGDYTIAEFPTLIRLDYEFISLLPARLISSDGQCVRLSMANGSALYRILHKHPSRPTWVCELITCNSRAYGENDALKALSGGNGM
jgi:hypothetical protein